MNVQTADLCDQFEAELRICAPMFHSYGGRAAFGGELEGHRHRQVGAFERGVFRAIR
mgnify:CR=1 FL=1